MRSCLEGAPPVIHFTPQRFQEPADLCRMHKGYIFTVGVVATIVFMVMFLVLLVAALVALVVLHVMVSE